MANDFQWLLAMHDTAARFGDGLKPELEALLRRDMTRFGPGVQDMNIVPVSSGPVQQTATKAQLADAGIPSIGPGASPRSDATQARDRSKRSASDTTEGSQAPRKKQS